VLQNVFMRLSRTPGAVEWAGRPLGADTDALLDELGVDARTREALRADGVV
jgi:crotonobetainyl-CoA:carnitine CoA-transferase CaiB-like acyl-CoA transferase